MKKIVKLVVSMMMVFPLVGCNQSIGIGNLKFDKVHIKFGDFNGCLEIQSWHDNEMGIEVKTKEYGSLYLSEGTYMLVEDECPICDSKKIAE